MDEIQSPSITATPPHVPSRDVSRLLSQSRTHNLNRLRYGNARQYHRAEAEAASALAARLQAHDLDPLHGDPSWALDSAPHDQIVAFLQGYPSIP